MLSFKANQLLLFCQQCIERTVRTKTEHQLREKDRESREKEEQLTRLQRQLDEKDLQEASLQEQLRGKTQQEENSQRQLREMEQQLREKDEQKETLQRQQRESERQLTDFQEQLREKDFELENSERLSRQREQQLTNFQSQLREKELQEASLREQLREKDQQEENLQRQLEEMEQQLREMTEQEESLQTQLREMTQQLTNVQERLTEREEEFGSLQQQVTTLQGQLRAKDQDVNELEVTLATARQALSQNQHQQPPDWVCSRDQIQLTDKLLGRGGWGFVVEGKYCGCAVAVKQIYELILSAHNRSLFEREMDIASRCRHPCLLQFIGATNDEGSPLFLTELMESSLRTLLQQRPLSETEVPIISLDVARALSYLHQKTPPIIHRDISSANVLLWRQGDQWRGKVSDYGTANFMQHTMTVAPGAVIYIAPEALTSNQTVKVSDDLRHILSLSLSSFRTYLSVETNETST